MSDPIRQLSFWQSPVFLVNSRLGPFAATSYVSIRRLPFSRSYRVNLPSSLAVTHSSTLVRLYPTTCVGLRYGCLHNCPSHFSWKLLRVIIPVAEAVGYYQSQRTFNALFRQCADTCLLRHKKTHATSAGILTRSPSGRQFPWPLRCRLTLIRLTLIRKP